MKKLILLLGLFLLVNYSLRARVLQRDIEGGAPIEVTVPQRVTEVEKVEEYEYEGSNKSEEQYDYKADKTFNEGINMLAKSDVEKQVSKEPQQKNEETEAKEVVFRPVAVEHSTELVLIKKEEIKQAYFPDEKGDTFFGASFGFANTRYDELDSNFNSGSWKLELMGYKMISGQESIGLALSFLQPKGNELVVENTSISSLRFFFMKNYFLSQNLYFTGSLGLSVADFNIRRTVYENQNLITYKKIKSGLAFGVTPEIGLRYFVERGIYIDTAIEYLLFLGDDNKSLGDWAFKPRLNISF